MIEPKSEARRNRQAEAQHADTKRDQFVATRKTGAQRLQDAAHEKILDALENILRIKVARGLRDRRDDDAQDEAGSQKRNDDEKEHIDQHLYRDAPDRPVEGLREFVDPIRGENQLEREMKRIGIAKHKRRAVGLDISQLEKRHRNKRDEMQWVKPRKS